MHVNISTYELTFYVNLDDSLSLHSSFPPIVPLPFQLQLLNCVLEQFPHQILLLVIRLWTFEWFPTCR